MPSASLIYSDKHRLTESEWALMYRPISNDSDMAQASLAGWGYGGFSNCLYDSAGEDLEAVRRADPNTLWSLVSVNNTGEVFILAGSVGDWYFPERYVPAGSGFSLMGYFISSRYRKVKTLTVQLAPADSLFASVGGF